jgi:signal transduction histidine kinase
VKNEKQRALLSWLSLGALLVLCGVLGVLQYRWIGEVSRAERERLGRSLQASLGRLSQDFNSEISTACAALLPNGPPPEQEPREEDYATRYARWKEASRHGQLFRRIALVVAQGDRLVLRNLDLERGVFGTADWPAEWSKLRDRITAWLSSERPEPPPQDEGLLIELPRFRPPQAGAPAPWFGRREGQWLIFELDLEYVRGVILPEILQRHLGSGGSLDYQVEVVTRTSPPALIYQSPPNQATRIGNSADASVNLFELQYGRMAWRAGPPGMRAGDQGRGPGPSRGRWQMSVRHRAGSLEAVVAAARRRNLAVIAAILLLMLATATALVRSARHAQRLAHLQMDFVAGVSHELRTPLTVIRTAAYNLRGQLAHNPSQVERYGTLIQQESERLTELVEQILWFARAKAGRPIRETEPLSVEAVINESVESSKGVIEGARCVVETSIEPGLPLILGDAAALRHALQNLLSNAAKYGTEGGNWIGVFARRSAHQDLPAVEIRVADRGPGIPAEEQDSIFDPFFRGKRAVQDQIRGTGLGLSLVKGIVEAHGGTIAVNSQPAKGTEFVVRLPAAPPELQDEFSHSASRG